MQVAAYARVSSSAQKEEETINSQIDQLKKYIQEKGYNLVKTYADEGFSGELLNRPGLDSLRDDAAKKHFEKVIILCPDRLARVYIYQGIVREEFKKYGVDIEFLNGSNSETPEDRMSTGMQGVFADYEKEKILERTRRGKLFWAKQGRLIASIAPYGYRYITRIKKERDGRYVINEEEATVVRLIFDLFVKQGKSLRAIVKALAEKNIRPRKGKTYWGRSSVARVLKNETYFGITYYNKNMSVESLKPRKANEYKRVKRTGRKLRDTKVWIAIPVPAIINDRSIFDKAQKLFKRNIELSPRNTRNQYLLRGLVRCECGELMFGTPSHHKLFYRCGKRFKTFPEKSSCKVPSIKSEKLDELAWDTFCRVIQHPDIILSQVRKYQARQGDGNELVLKELGEIEMKLASYTKKENDILDLVLEGDFQKDILDAKLKAIREEQSRLMQRKQVISTLVRTPQPRNADKEITVCCDKIAENLKTLSDNFEQKQRLLRLFFENINIVGKKIRVSGIVPGELLGSTASTMSL